MSGTSLIDLAISRSRTMVLLLALITGVGMFSYQNMAREAEPDVDLPYVYVSMGHEGIAPSDAERLLIRPMEQELRTISGLKEMRASAFDGGASITLEFYVGIDPDKAVQDTRDKVDTAKAELPAETDEPSVTEIKISRMDPMLIVQIGGAVPERTLTNIARSLKDSIETLPGVLEVQIAGDREEVMEVVVDPLAMESYGLTQSDLFALVSRNNQLVATGALNSTSGRFPVKVPGVFETVEDVLNLPIKVDGERVVHFSDIASVRRTYKDATSFARINGNPSIALDVVKRGGANIIRTTDEVKAMVAREQAFWPDTVSTLYSRDKSTDVRTMVDDLENNVMAAVLLVFIVIVGILGVRSAVLVGIAIPGSFLTALLVLYATGITLNMVVLFTLILAVGMLVDGAIVVTELADRKMAEGMTRERAYSTAARRMAWPIIASTATTVAAFVPLLFWPGFTGQFMSFLPKTLIITLCSSLLLALVFVPVLGSIFGRAAPSSEGVRKALAAAEDGDLRSLPGLTGRYVRMLDGALRHPMLNVAGVSALLLGIYMVYGTFGNGLEFWPSVEPEFANVNIRARGDLSTMEKNHFVSAVEARISDMDEITSLYAKAGGGDSANSDIIGTLQLGLAPWQQRREAALVLQEVRDRTSDIAGLIVETQTPSVGSFEDKPVNVRLASRSPILLDDAVAQIRATMQAQEGLQGIVDSRPLPGIEWQLSVDRAQAARFGADIALVGNTVQLVTTGVKIGEYRPDDVDEEVEIRVRYPEATRSIEALDTLQIPTDNGLVPLSNFVTRTATQQVGLIERTDLQRTRMVSADLVPGANVSAESAILMQTIAELKMDSQVSVSLHGDTEEQEQSMQFLIRAMLVAMLVITIILVTQFNSIFQAFLILTAVAFSTGGVLLGHLILAKPFGVIMSGTGVVALAGIVVNNNIVLIDTYNHLRATGLDAAEAILRTCAQRLRPVMLTTVTTILGLLPMVFGVTVDLFDRQVSVGSPSSQWWTQLSTSVAVGLAFATLLTLLLTPSLLMVQANVSAWVKARRRGTPDDNPRGGSDTSTNEPEHAV